MSQHPQQPKNHAHALGTHPLASSPLPGFVPAPKLGKAEGRGITGGNTMQFSKSFRLSELGCLARSGRPGLGRLIRGERFLVLLVVFLRRHLEPLPPQTMPTILVLATTTVTCCIQWPLLLCGAASIQERNLPPHTSGNPLSFTSGGPSR